jgi:hypothetical protein
MCHSLLVSSDCVVLAHSSFAGSCARDFEPLWPLPCPRLPGGSARLLHPLNLYNHAHYICTALLLRRINFEAGSASRAAPVWAFTAWLGQNLLATSEHAVHRLQQCDQQNQERECGCFAVTARACFRADVCVYVLTAQGNSAGDVNIPSREEKTTRKDVDRPAQRDRDVRQIEESFTAVEYVLFVPRA